MIQFADHYYHLLFVLTLILCAAGAWISGHLLKLHDNVWLINGDGAQSFLTRLCGAKTDCHVAMSHPGARIRVPIPRPHRNLSVSLSWADVPVAFIGLAYFSAMFIWFALTSGSRPNGSDWHQILVVFCSAAAVGSVLLLGLMATGKAPVCGGCVAVHLINLALALVVWRSAAIAPQLPAPDAQLAAGPAREVAIAISVSAVAAAGMFFYRRARLLMRDQLRSLLPYRELVNQIRRDPAVLMREYLAEPQVTIPLRSGELAPPGHARIVVFTDYQCPACYCSAQEIAEQVAPRFAGRAALLVRHFPLCRQCNDQVEHDGDVASCEAAYAAEAARIMGGEVAFRRFHVALFANRSRLDQRLYGELATQAGLDPQKLVSLMQSEMVRQAVRDDVDLARQLGVEAVPAVFLDGRFVPELCRAPAFWGAVAERLVSTITPASELLPQFGIHAR